MAFISGNKGTREAISGVGVGMTNLGTGLLAIKIFDLGNMRAK